MKVFHAFLNEIEEMRAYAEDLPLLERAMTVLRTEVGLHATLEEELLLPALEPYVPTNGLFAELRADHQKIRHGLEQIDDAQDINEALQSIPDLLDTARTHFQKEDEVLYALAEQLLDDETLSRLGETWAAERSKIIS